MHSVWVFHVHRSAWEGGWNCTPSSCAADGCRLPDMDAGEPYSCLLPQEEQVLLTRVIFGLDVPLCS